MFSNETKIGLLTIVSIALLIWGYKFLKGKNILLSSTLLYVEYADVDQLSVSTPVLRNGFQVGIVGDIYFKEDMTTLEVVLDLDKDIRVPKTAVAEIISTGFMGGRAVNLKFDHPCSGSDCAKSGDKIKGHTKKLFASMVGDPKELGSYMDVIKNDMGDIVDTIKNKLADPDGKPNKSVEDLKATLANLNSATARLDRMLAQSSGNITSLMSNTEAITANLQANNAKISSIISNADMLSKDLAAMNLKATVEKANGAMDGASGAIAKMETTLGAADEAVHNLTTVLQKINNNEGTLGLLVNDKELYNNLDRTLQNMDFLLQDLRLHPERYRRILSKKKMPYKAPETDPAFDN